MYMTFTKTDYVIHLFQYRLWQKKIVFRIRCTFELLKSYNWTVTTIPSTRKKIPNTCRARLTRTGRIVKNNNNCYLSTYNAVVSIKSALKNRVLSLSLFVSLSLSIQTFLPESSRASVTVTVRQRQERDDDVSVSPQMAWGGRSNADGRATKVVFCVWVCTGGSRWISSALLSFKLGTIKEQLYV